MTRPICPSEDTNATDPTHFIDDNGIHFTDHSIGWTICGVAAAIATLISLVNIIRHARNYHNKKQQRQIIRILLMIPIYSILSFLSYRYYRTETYFNVVRNMYECVAIASFFILLLLFVGDSTAAQKESLRRHRRVKVIFPLNCFSFDASNPNVLHILKIGVLQYVVVRPTTTLVSLITEPFGLYCTASLSPYYANVYVTAANFVAVTVAMFSLFQLYVIVHTDIADRRPFMKFIAIKLAIFFGFYQSFIFSLLSHYGKIKATQYWTTANIESGLDDLAITIEMVLFAIFHFFAYPSSEYPAPPGTSHTPVFKSLFHAFNPVDFLREIWEGIKFLTVCWTRRPSGPETEPGIASEFDIEDVFLGRNGTVYQKEGPNRRRLERHGGMSDSQSDTAMMVDPRGKAYNGSFENVPMTHLRPNGADYRPSPEERIPLGNDAPQPLRYSPRAGERTLPQYEPQPSQPRYDNRY